LYKVVLHPINVASRLARHEFMIARPLQLLPDTQLESLESLNISGTEWFSVGGALVSEETPRKKAQRGENKNFTTWFF
jgi:hypothetical protein